jgi:cellulose synthase/poly-beta-1,6-N-acetylglucosamine synthase-like glycosyltransferase
MDPKHLVSLSIRGIEYFFHFHLMIALVSYGIVAALLRKHLKHIQYRLLSIDKVPFEQFKSPKVALIIPAFNEAEGILNSINAALSSDYPNFEVIVFNDGSTDSTLQKIITNYGLNPTREKPSSILSNTKVFSVYKSQKYKNLKVIDTAHSGKWDTMNWAFGYCDADFICGMDADSIITPEALGKMIVKFIDEPNLVALGGAIIPSNEVIIENGKITRRKTSQPMFVGIQIIEYLRSFTSWRTGWSYLDGLMIIGGALTMFKKDAVIKAGGYKKESICEDFELILSLHEYHLNNNLPYHIWTIPDVICWTRVPANRDQLKKQRIRWMWGALQSISWHRNLAFTLKSRMIGWFSFPHLIFIETLAPIIEFIGHVCFIAAILYGLLSYPSLIIFGILVYMITGFYSWYSLAINDYYMSSFTSLWQIIRLGLFGLIEPLGYRQRDAYWRMIAWWRWVTNKKIEWK